MDYLKTFVLIRAILDAPLQTVEGANVGKELQNLAEEYTEKVFPNIHADKKRVIDEMTRDLMRWVSNVAAIEATPLPTLMEQVRAEQRKKKGKQQHLSRIEHLSMQMKRRLE